MGIPDAESGAPGQSRCSESVSFTIFKLLSQYYGSSESCPNTFSHSSIPFNFNEKIAGKLSRVGLAHLVGSRR
jgi:hypothetical protein